LRCLADWLGCYQRHEQVKQFLDKGGAFRQVTSSITVQSFRHKLNNLGVDLICPGFVFPHGYDLFQTTDHSAVIVIPVDFELEEFNQFFDG
jgi:hypothetical protein